MNTSIHKLILLADDDADDAEMFGSVLKEVAPDVEFLHLENGAALIEYLNNHQNKFPGVIFLDVNMPELNGWQCLSAIKGDRRLQDIPVIMYSTSSHPHDKQISVDLGARAFITKPSDLKGLYKIIKEVTRNYLSDRSLTTLPK